MTRTLVWGLALLVTLACLFALQNREGALILSQADSSPEGNSSSSDIPDAIEPPCLSAAQELESPETLTIRTLDLSISPSRQWQTNLMEAALSSSPNISRDFKKKFDATLSVAYDNETTCTFAAKIRLSGDWKDHLGPVESPMVASMDVALEKGNIDGIVRFKLLRPETRNRDSEILAAEIFRQVGVLSPRTRNVFVIVNGVPATMIMQENLEKELLENQGQRESVTLETDESMVWAERVRTKSEATERDIELAFARTTNSEWATRGPANESIAWSGMQLLSRALAATWTGFPIADDLISHPRSSARQLLSRMRILSLAMRAEHGLAQINRRFYFDPMLDGLLPVYYDGDARLSSLQELQDFSDDFTAWEQRYLQGVASADLDDAQRVLNEINSTSLFLAVTNNGAGLSQSHVDQALSAMQANIRSMHNLLPDQIDPFWQPMQHAQHPADFRLVFGTSPLTMQSCDKNLLSCQPLSADDAYRDLLRGRLVIDGEQLKYAGPSLAAYRQGRDPLPGYSNQPAPTYIDEAAIYTFGAAEVDIDEEQKVLVGRLTGESDRILIRDGDISNWSITIEGPTGQTREGQGRFDENLLTGCLTLVDTHLNDVDIETNGGLCEDSLNLIRTSGTLNEIDVSNSDQDAIDMDFSSVSISNMTVTGAGNDCLDLSAGTYDLQVLTATSCSDKAVSVGEASTVSIASAEISGATYGFVAKDSSLLTLRSSAVTDVEICASAYRKKQEFGGAIITLGNFQCPSGELTSQAGSEIRPTS